MKRRFQRGYPQGYRFFIRVDGEREWHFVHRFNSRAEAVRFFECRDGVIDVTTDVYKQILRAADLFENYEGPESRGQVFGIADAYQQIAGVLKDGADGGTGNMGDITKDPAFSWYIAPEQMSAKSTDYVN